jgi:serine/threonine protein kinase
MSERSIFLTALEKKAGAERGAYLDEACGADAALRQRIEALLRSHGAAGKFLDVPALKQMASPAAPRPAGETLASEGASDRNTPSLDFLAPPRKPSSLGRLGHYEVLEVVGQGGMGTVLKAFDEKLHRTVAIKVLEPALAANRTACKRFVREARAAAAVKNDHVIAIHNVEDEQQPPYLVMELIDGMSLQERLDRDGPPADVREILRIGMQAAEGLAAAHKQGLVHRDIKPANILLENSVQRVKITDFGLARAVDDGSLSQSGVVSGTPQYMSPEQAEGLAVDHRSDLFSLGSVLYALCTGHAPFRASGAMAVLKRVCEETPRPIREINPEIPEWLVAVINKLHAKNPADRIQSATELAELLGKHLAQLQMPAAKRTPAQAAAGQSPRSQIEVTCSECNKTYRVDASLRGKKIRCRVCNQVFVVPASAAPAKPARSTENISKRAPMTIARQRDEDDEDVRPPTSRRHDDDQDEGDEDDRRRRRKRKKQAAPPWALFVGGGVGGLVLIGVIVALVFALRGDKNDPVAQGKPGAPNAANPQAQPQGQAQFKQAQPQPPGPAGIDDLGEKVLPADKAPNDAPLRHPKGIPLYRLSNLRVGNLGPGPGPQLIVHYERVAGEERGTGPTLVIRTKDGNEHNTIGGFGPFGGMRKAGDFQVGFRFGFGSALPKDLEVYLIHVDRRFEGEGFRPRFKVSNSAVMGDMGRPLQYARAWTAEEAAKLNNPPAEAPQMNANNNVGQDTEFVGHTQGLLPPMRYADPNKRSVIGVLYMAGERMADKDGPKMKCLIQLTPAYDPRQPRYLQQALFAKPGYAVGGLNVKTKEIVTAVQVIFMKQKADGTLDPADKYTSQWLGHPEEADTEKTITSDGRKVIGMHLKHFGQVFAVALVLE